MKFGFPTKTKKEREKSIKKSLILNGFINLDVKLCQIAMFTRNMKVQAIPFRISI